MISSSDSSRTKTWFLTAGGVGWLLLIPFTLYVCYFSHLGAIGFVGPDEPRYAWIAREMVESGDWITPRLYGKPWFEKPVLYYWGAALSFKLFGVNEAAARLPSAVAALLATLALAWLAWRLYGVETVRWLLLLLPTTVGMIGFSHAASPDMPFTAMLTIAMVPATVLLRLVRPVGAQPDPESERRNVAPHLGNLPAAILFGFFLALAVLAKGPAAIILCGGAVFLWALFTKRWRDAFRLLHPAAIVTCCLTALPWYILCAHRNPDFFRVFIIEHNFKRYLTPEFQHIQPFWFYLPIILVAVFPWTLQLLALVSDARRAWIEDAWRSSATFFFACSIVFTLAFFSISKSKLPGYILPALPLLGLLVAQAVSCRLQKRDLGNGWLGITAGATLLCFNIAILIGRKKIPFVFDYFPPRPLRWTCLAAIVAGFIALVLAFRRHTAASLISVILAFMCTFVAALTGEARMALDWSVSPRWAAEFAARYAPDDWASDAATYKLRRGFQYGLNFYAHRELPEMSNGSLKHRRVFTSRSQIAELRNEGYQCLDFFPAPAVLVCGKRQSVESSPASNGHPR